MAKEKSDSTTIDCGDNAAVYASGLVARGYEATAADGKVTTNAPADVFKAMDAAYRSRNDGKKK